MIAKRSPQFVGSIIGLRSESTAQYRALHDHPFPAVIERISRSNIRNYSIFLRDGLLFSYYDYIGHDYAADMAAIGEDEVTRQWWTLTDAMQQPLEERRAAEWWATLQCLHEEAGQGTARHEAVTRMAFVAPLVPVVSRSSEPGAPVDGIDRLRVFQSRASLYFYVEARPDSEPEALPIQLQAAFELPSPPESMTPVFYTHRPRVFVTGCFDMLHSGHVEFFRAASSLGALCVGIGSDATVRGLKGRFTINSQEERRFMIEALSCVSECRVNSGGGFLDFEDDIRANAPDIFVTNGDGHSPAKEALCRELGIEYVVLDRQPHPGLPARSTTRLRGESTMPYRIDLAGGWLDQPYVSCHHPGPVITISIEPTIEFNDRSGMASSTRRKAVELWRTSIPHGDPVVLAKTLFAFENPPGTKEVAGSQDALGIVLPGLNYLYYERGYWPTRIESVNDDDLLEWLENRLHLVTLGPRASEFSVLEKTSIDFDGAKALATAADDCWRAILSRDARAMGDAFRRAFEAQVRMFPLMVDESIDRAIDLYRDRSLGWKLSGAGGGGYLVLVSEEPIEATHRIKIRRRSSL